VNSTVWYILYRNCYAVEILQQCWINFISNQREWLSLHVSNYDKFLPSHAHLSLVTLNFEKFHRTYTLSAIMPQALQKRCMTHYMPFTVTEQTYLVVQLFETKP
jgi:hypothetical protein